MLKAMMLITFISQTPSGAYEITIIPDYKVRSIEECASAKALRESGMEFMLNGKPMENGNITVSATAECVFVSMKNFQTFTSTYMIAE